MAEPRADGRPPYPSHMAPDAGLGPLFLCGPRWVRGQGLQVHLGHRAGGGVQTGTGPVARLELTDG